MQVSRSNLTIRAEARTASSRIKPPQRKLFADIKNIAKSEMDFVRDVIEIIVPVKITWNEDAWQKMQERSIVRVEPRAPRDQ